MASLRSRTFLSRPFFVASAAAVMFAIHAAAAQPISAHPLIAPGEPQPWVPQTVPKHSTTYCSRSTITSIELMKLIQKIISHGNLTDVAFIEKSLNTRFKSSYGSKEDGSPDTQTIYYNSDDVLGNPVHVEVDVWSKEMQKKREEIADITFQGVSDKNFIADCLHLDTSEFFAFFGGNFTLVGPNGLLPIKEAYQNYGTLGKNGTKLYLSTSFGADDRLVGGIEVVQRP